MSHGDSTSHSHSVRLSHRAFIILLALRLRRMSRTPEAICIAPPDLVVSFRCLVMMQPWILQTMRVCEVSLVSPRVPDASALPPSPPPPLALMRSKQQPAGRGTTSCWTFGGVGGYPGEPLPAQGAGPVAMQPDRSGEAPIPRPKRPRRRLRCDQVWSHTSQVGLFCAPQPGSPRLDTSAVGDRRSASTPLGIFLFVCFLVTRSSKGRESLKPSTSLRLHIRRLRRLGRRPTLFSLPFRSILSNTRIRSP